ncbi:SigB/SigF/SigG family RNA polymerase sigma factor [Streptomyces sp. NPDC059096]|uniref:SigB/SigF/SigG family RNA polymerase sigma factor n=1 Tax=Streptomyces sp. NPDC059096 TaxID=3346727 RepID=UPI00368CC255
MMTSTEAERTPELLPVPAEAGMSSGELPWIEDAGSIAPKDARALSKQFFSRLAVLEEGSAEYQYVRNTLIEMNQTLVHFVARRFRNRGNGDTEDIAQVGMVGLIKAIDRFELSREVEFTSFAVPCISGEIKRFFRDTTWAVHVPRRLQELRGALGEAQEQLSVVHNRSPTVAELSEHLRVSEEEVVQGLVAANGYTAGSLDLPAGSGDGLQANKSGRVYADTVGDWDHSMELVEDLESLAPLLGELGDRDRLILELRFGQEMTQDQIAQEIGVSQMHVSRLLNRILATLRTGLLSTG